MPLFDAYVMVDWSGANRRRGGHAEIYPNVRAPLTDNIKDRGQVRAM